MNELECPMCSSTEAEYLGKLGSLEWYRCRHCGFDFEYHSDPPEEEVA